MKKKYLSIALVLVSSLGLLGWRTQSAHAAAKTQNADFEIQPILPENQVNDSLNYFNLQTKPGMKQTIRMQIQNFTDHKITVKSDLRNAFTQIGGGIAFTPSTKGLDESLKTPFTTVAKLQKTSQTIYLGPQETKMVSTDIKMPEEKFKGLIYGDWHFTEYLKQPKTGGSAIKSNYAYSLGVALRGSHYKVYPELKYKSTGPLLYNNHPAMGVTLRNVEPMALSKAAVSVVVQKDGLFASKRIFNTTNKTIAPNSTVTFPVSWAFDTLKPGKYTVKVKVKAFNFWNNLPMTWNFNEKLTVKDSDVKTINQQALKKPINKWTYVATASGILVLVSTVELLRLLRLGA